MWFCSSPFGNAHRPAKSSRVLISGCGFFIICLIDTFIRGKSSSQHCVAAFGLSSWYWNTSFRVFIPKVWKSASWWFDCRYPCLRSINAFPWSSERTFERLPSWRIWSEKWFRECIFTKMKSESSRRCCAISASSCSLSSSTRWHFEPQKDCSKWGHFPVPPVCPKQAAFTRLLRLSVYLYLRGIDWKHPCDDETPPENSPCTWLGPQYGTGTVPWGENIQSSWRTTGLLWRESFRSLKGWKESPRILNQSHARVHSFPYHSIASPGYMACWIEHSQDIKGFSPRAGWICWSWTVVWGRMLPNSSNF